MQHIAHLFSKSYIETVAAWVAQLNTLERSAFARLLQSLLAYNSGTAGTKLQPVTPVPQYTTYSATQSVSPLTHMVDTSSYLASFKTPDSAQGTRWYYDDTTATRLSVVAEQSLYVKFVCVPMLWITRLRSRTVQHSSSESEYSREFRGTPLPAYASPRLPDDLSLVWYFFNIATNSCEWKSADFFDESKLPVVEGWLSRAPRKERTVFHVLMRHLSRFAARYRHKPSKQAAQGYRSTVWTKVIHELTVVSIWATSVIIPL